MMRQRILFGPAEFVPHLLWRRPDVGRRGKLIPAIGRGAALRTHAASQHAEKFETTRYLPTALVTRSGVAPDVTGKGRARPGSGTRHVDDHARLDAAFLCGILRRIHGIMRLNR